MQKNFLLCKTLPYNIRVMTHASSQKLMPAPVATPGPRNIEGTPFASFQAHMLSFRDRVATMLDQSSAGSGLDISDIHTPVSQLALHRDTEPLFQ